MSHKMHCHLEECCFWWADNKAISATHCQDAVQITLQNCICGARFHYSESFQNLLCNTVPLYSALLDGWNYLPLCLHAIWWAETVPKTKVIAPRLVHHTQFAPIWVQRISHLLFDWHGCHLAGHLSTTHPYCILSAYIVSSACNPMLKYIYRNGEDSCNIFLFLIYSFSCTGYLLYGGSIPYVYHSTLALCGWCLKSLFSFSLIFPQPAT